MIRPVFFTKTIIANIKKLKASKQVITPTTTAKKGILRKLDASSGNITVYIPNKRLKNLL